MSIVVAAGLIILGVVVGIAACIGAGVYAFCKVLEDVFPEALGNLW